jgi:hypothetical protein
MDNPTALKFMQANKALLRCYGTINPNDFQRMDFDDQKAFCAKERRTVESMLERSGPGALELKDFFN